MNKVFIFMICVGLMLGIHGNVSADDKGPMMEEKAVSMEPKGSGVVEKVAPMEPKGSHMGGHNTSTAVAHIMPTGPDSKANGWVKFIKHPEGVKVMGYISGLKQAGKHGIHVHGGGSCDNAGKAAGGHFNPHGVDHGFYPKDGNKGAHLGDMGNIEIDKYGTGSFMLDLSEIEFDGPMGVVGHAVILHQKEDDFGQPTGHAGARIACGVIE